MQRLSLLGKKVEAMLKSAWTKKDQMDKPLEKQEVNEELGIVWLVGRLYEGVHGGLQRTYDFHHMMFSIHSEHQSEFIHNEDGNPIEASLKSYDFILQLEFCKEILLKLELPDHRIRKDGGEVLKITSLLTSKDKGQSRAKVNDLFTTYSPRESLSLQAKGL
ncbi:hypothetical protein Tco_0270036 [Tanacetum coccineum]